MFWCVFQVCVCVSHLFCLLKSLQIKMEKYASRKAHNGNWTILQKRCSKSKIFDFFNNARNLLKIVKRWWLGHWKAQKKYFYPFLINFLREFCFQKKTPKCPKWVQKRQNYNFMKLLTSIYSSTTHKIV